MIRTMSLRDLLAAYIATNACGRRYIESLRRTVKKAEDSGLSETCQLDSERVNKFLVGLSCGPTTRHNIRRELLTLWRWAYDEGMAEVYPARVRKIRPAYSAPEAWQFGELQSILAKAEADMRPVSRRVKLVRSDVLPAWIGLAYDSGLRFTDIHGMTERHFRNGCVVISASKTGKPAVRQLSEKTQGDVARLFTFSPDGTLFKWFLPRRRAFLMWRSFLDANGFGGSTKWFRRAAATQIEMLKPGEATWFLQHSDPQLARRHYIDISQVHTPMAPPPLRR